MLSASPPHQRPSCTRVRTRISKWNLLLIQTPRDDRAWATYRYLTVSFQCQKTIRSWPIPLKTPKVALISRKLLSSQKMSSSSKTVKSPRKWKTRLQRTTRTYALENKFWWSSRLKTDKNCTRIWTTCMDFKYPSVRRHYQKNCLSLVKNHCRRLKWWVWIA